MKNLFIIDGAAGTGKTDLLTYVANFGVDNVLIPKYSTRAKRPYEHNDEWRLDLETVSDERFDKLKLDYHYTYAGHRYGFRRSELVKALSQSSNVFVIVRNAATIGALCAEYAFINVVPVYVYTDRDRVRRRLQAQQVSDDDIEARLGRSEIAFQDYLNHPEVYREVLINNASQRDFHQLIDRLLHKYRDAPEVDERLIFLLMSFNPGNPALTDYANAIKRAVISVDNRLICMNLDDVRAGAYAISTEAKAHIRKCRLAIIDLTENKPNVYYELGFAHGIEKKCILTAESMTRPHFYPLEHKIIYYDNASSLEVRLKEELRGVIRHELI